MAVATAKRKLTYADFERIPEDRQRHEIVDGEHCASPSPKIGHQDVVGNVYWLLKSYVRETGAGRVFATPLDVILSENDIVEPDLIFVAAEHEHLLQDYIVGAPDLLIEVLSPSTRRRDQNLKRKRYEQLGVGEYWLVDPGPRTVTILRRNADSRRFDVVARVSSGSFGTPLMPGLEIPLSEIFRS